MLQKNSDRSVLCFFVAGLCLSLYGIASGAGFYLGESKDELELAYDVEVIRYSSGETSTGRVSVAFTLKDEGRLEPLDDIELVIPAENENSDGSHWMDLVVAIDMKQQSDGTRVGRVHLLESLARRASIRLNTRVIDGKSELLSTYHYAVPLRDCLAQGDTSDEDSAPDAR